MHRIYIEPLHTDFKNPYDYQPVREEYINKPNTFDPLRDLLNSTLEKVVNYLRHTYPTQILVDGLSFDYDLDYQILNKKKVQLFRLDSGLVPIVYGRKPHIIIKNQSDPNISSIFIGMFEDDVRYSGGTINVPFRINPPYISFRFL